MLYLKRLLAGACLFLITPSFSQVRLPQLVSSGMVLQRDMKINVWGWASPGEKVHIHFHGKQYSATAAADSNWKVELDALPAGGPYSMDIRASNHIVLSDIVIGDVWFCSGQSNMVLPMERVKEKYPQEISAAEYPLIRNFFVPTLADVTTTHRDLPPGKWTEANPKNVLSFGAASFFFAKQLYLKYRVPIGLINSSVGGTPIQAWISEQGIKSVDNYPARVAQFHDTAFMKQVMQPPVPAPAQPIIEDSGTTGPAPWYSPGYVPHNWHSFWLPGYWADQGIRGLNGVVWFRKEIDVPASMTGMTAKLFLGRIVDADQAYVNGQLVGGITYQYPPRRYDVPAGLLKPGKNIIVVRVVNFSGKGGFVPDKNYSLQVGDQRIDLRGDWSYQVSEAFEPARTHATFSAEGEPTGLFNTMVAPAVPYRVKGFLWYQGEANTGKPEEYNQLLPALILDWRAQWKEGDIPFLFVQLPNFMEVQYLPSSSQWATLREAQLHALSLPNTGMAVAIDAGEWNDIHPLNKKVVGERLALLAEKIAYGDKNVVASGPLYQSSRVDGKSIVLHFSNTGSGLAAEGGPLSQFAIAGPDGRFVWAGATISGDSVMVTSPKVTNPRYVRYAWADNPRGANLCNKDGLPASPFRTDDPFGPYAGTGAVLPAGQDPGLSVWNNKQCAVVLTYDDAIDADLDNVVPALDSMGLRGTFYIIGSSDVMGRRLNEWRAAASEGHELGNHALFHPCDGTLPGRGFVTPDDDLSKYTVSRAVSELRMNNVFLKAIDGKDRRTFAYPCGDLKIGDSLFYKSLSKEFAGARGVNAVMQTAADVNLDNIDAYAINGQSAEFMIDLVKKAEQTHTLLVFLFHGVGGGHDINEGLAEHSALLHYLKDHEQQVWVAPMVEVADRIRAYQAELSTSRP